MRERGQRPGSIDDRLDSSAHSPTPGKRSLVPDIGSADGGGMALPDKRSMTGDLAAAPSGTSSGASSGGAPLRDDVRSRMESAFGADFSAVRIHENGAADAVGAQAYARGTDLYFGPGTYDPDSPQGLELIGHELTHVVQQQGRAPGRAQMKSTLIVDDSPLEREADALGARAARGEYVGMFTGTAAPGSIQRKTKVNPVAAAKKDKVTLIGDGTPGNTGLSLPDLDAYIKAQADWFIEPTLAAPADRDAVWKVVHLIAKGPHVTIALPTTHAGEIVKLAPADMTKLLNYLDCFDTVTETIQLTTSATTLARALELGQGLADLKAFVPTSVLRIVIPEAGLTYLVDNKKITALKTYYTAFKPTLETQDEWPHIVKLLNDGVAKYTALAAWIHDLHVFTVATRDQLLKNIADTSRARPVMLILFSAVDWNTAFLQGANIEAAALNTKTLALVVQGVGSLAAATSEVTRIADTYGQQPMVTEPKTGKSVPGPGRLGQVVIAGHGSDTSVEMSSPGTGPSADLNSKNVDYYQDKLDSTNPGGGIEALIDTIISRMDPKDVDIAFAGCLVNSHEVAATTNLTGTSAQQQKKLQAALAKHPNLADYVRDRINKAGATGTVTAANASATFDSFNIDPATGKARISSAFEPKLGGTKLEYLQQGNEPEGALRAALECIADPAIGPTKTTTEIRTRVAGLAASKVWWQVITRTGLELCLPKGAGDVDAAKLLDVVHRIGAWFEILWENTSDLARLVANIKTAEVPIVFAAMLGSNEGATADHIQVGINEVWMKWDASKGTPFMVALTASAFVRETFNKHLVRAIVDPQLGKLLPVTASPAKGQLLLALTIAAKDHKGMPKPVRDLLRAAAGGAKTTTFPAALNVPTLLAPVSELGVLEDIGLAPSSSPPPMPGSGGVTTVDGNVDANGDGKNETFIEVAPHQATVTADVLNVRAKPGMSGAIIDTVKKGDIVQVMGATQDGTWSLVDHGGKHGFMATRYLAT
jgi:hypothetical protein